MEVLSKVGRAFRKFDPFTKRLYHTSYSTRTHTCGELRAEHVGAHVSLCGWMSKPRLIGHGVAFIPLFDATGSTQLVCQNQEHLNVVKSLSLESVIKVNGTVVNRPEGNLNKDMATGSIEVEVDSLEVLNRSSALPFLPYSKATNISDELMLKERHIHNRRPIMQQTLRFRSKVSDVIRQFLLSKDFIEIETPTLFKPTPEGAKEFLVPTRESCKFFALTQSPQQYKQLLMVGGVDRYFQFARCYRDEDSRADRQPEFTQIDLEMSFVTEEGITSLIEDLLMDVFQKTLSHVAQPIKPFPVMSYRQAMDEYGSDKPDTRYDFKFTNLSEKWESICCNSQISLIASLREFSCIVLPIPHWKEMNEKLNHDDWQALWSSFKDHPAQFATVTFVSPINNKPNIIVEADDSALVSQAIELHWQDISESFKAIASSTTNKEDQCGFIIALFATKENTDEVLLSLGKMRTKLAGVLHSKGILSWPSNKFNFLWINKFPLFSKDDEGQLKCTHHPFTAPIEDHVELLHKAINQSDLAKITAQHYDLVLNGWELGGGSIRIHNADIQEYVLKNILHVDVQKFSHLLKGLCHGCPPHGGIALGFDRLIAVLCGLSSVRHVMAFPKSANGEDLLIGSPAEVPMEELIDYSIHSIIANNTKKS